jgi:predicted RND superfamily exporter protein
LAAARRSIQALVPVGLGCVWLLGLCGALGIPIGILAIAATPLVLGLGIDDGLHVLHGERRHGSVAGAVRRVGPAITMTSLTTCVGFGALVLSGIPAVRNMGIVVSLGILSSLVATLLVLPAVARRSPGSFQR